MLSLLRSILHAPFTAIAKFFSGILDPSCWLFARQRRLDSSCLSLSHEGKVLHIQGIRNLGNTCFLSCVLQSLASCSKFIAYLEDIAIASKLFAGDQMVQHPCIDELLQCVMHIRSLSPQKSNYCYNPSYLLKLIIEHNPSLGGQTQQDALECMQTIFSKIHQEITSLYETGDGASSLVSSISLGLLGHCNLSTNQRVGRIPGRIVIPSNPFQGWITSQIACEVCKSMHPEIIQVITAIPLTLPLPLSRDVSSLKSLQLTDCLEEFFRSEVLSDEVECSYCTATKTIKSIEEKVELYESLCSRRATIKTTNQHILNELQINKLLLDAIKKTHIVGETDKWSVDDDFDIKPMDVESNRTITFDESFIHRVRTSSVKHGAILRLPKIICINFHRMFYSLNGTLLKQNKHVSFPLHLSPSLLQGAHETSSTSYVLKAVITHQGSENSGHYMTYALVSKRWYIFSDHLVSEVHLKEVMQSQAFMLFYEEEGV